MVLTPFILAANGTRENSEESEVIVFPGPYVELRKERTHFRIRNRFLHRKPISSNQPNQFRLVIRRKKTVRNQRKLSPWYTQIIIRQRGKEREREKRLCWNHCFTRDVVKGSDCSTKDFPPPFVSFLFQYIELHKWKREISPWQTTKFSPLSWTFVDPVYRAQGSPISSTISYVNFHEYFCVWRFQRFALNAARYQERILHCLLLGRSLGSHVKIGNVSLWVHTAHEHYQNEIKINRTWIIVIWNSFKQINISIFFSERKSRLFPFLPTNNSIKEKKKREKKVIWLVAVETPGIEQSLFLWNWKSFGNK